ncbi:MAG: hypothetical protein ACQEVA_01030 [Myxococcota bacterium]
MDEIRPSTLDHTAVRDATERFLAQRPVLKRLYSLLPSIYKGDDDALLASRIEELLADGVTDPDELIDPRHYLNMLRVFDEGLGHARADIQRLWASFFVDTCPEWMLDELAWRIGLDPLSNHAWRGRAEIARTVGWRLRKGTPGVLDAIGDTLGNAAGVLREGHEVVARTPYLVTACDPRPVTPRIARIAEPTTDGHVRTFDLQEHEPGCYGPSRVGMELVLNPVHPVDGTSYGRTADGGLTFRSTGRLAPLFAEDTRRQMRWESQEHRPEHFQLRWLGARLLAKPTEQAWLASATRLADANDFPEIDGERGIQLLSTQVEPSALQHVSFRVDLIEQSLIPDAPSKRSKLGELTVLDLERQSLDATAATLPAGWDDPSELRVLVSVENRRDRTTYFDGATLAVRAPRARYRPMVDDANARRAGLVSGACYVELPGGLLRPGEERMFFLGVDGALYPAYSSDADDAPTPTLSAQDVAGSAPEALGGRGAWPERSRVSGIGETTGHSAAGENPEECLICLDETMLTVGFKLSAYSRTPRAVGAPTDAERVATAEVGAATAHGPGLDDAGNDESLMMVLEPPPTGPYKQVLPSEWAFRTRGGDTIIIFLPSVTFTSRDERFAVWVDDQGACYQVVQGDPMSTFEQGDTIDVLFGDRSTEGAFHQRFRFRDALAQVVPVAGVRPILQRSVRLVPQRGFDQPDVASSPRHPADAVRVCPREGTFGFCPRDPLSNGPSPSTTQSLSEHPDWLTCDYVERSLGVAGPGAAAGALEPVVEQDIWVQVSRDGARRVLGEGLLPSSAEDLAWFEDAVSALTELSAHPSVIEDRRVVVELNDARRLSGTLDIDVGNLACPRLVISAAAGSVADIGQPGGVAIRVHGSRSSSGSTPPRFELELRGAHISGDIVWEPDIEEGLLRFDRCAHIDGEMRVRAPVGGIADPDLRVELNRAITPGMEVEGPCRVEVADSIIGEAGLRAVASEPHDPMAGMCLGRVTVFGPVRVGALSATGCLFLSDWRPDDVLLDVDDPQGSCVRYSRVPPAVRWARPVRTYRCTESTPMVMERRLDAPDLATLGHRSTNCVLRGDEGREIGAGQLPARSLRVDNVHHRFAEYAPMAASLSLTARDG